MAVASRLWHRRLLVMAASVWLSLALWTAWQGAHPPSYISPPDVVLPPVAASPDAGVSP